MPRRPRLLLPDIPLHITQRGVNRCATFVDADDHRFYLALMSDVLVAGGIQIHAYALMGNHVHLLVTPSSGSDLSHAMRRLNQRYVGAFNRRHGRTGTLWESRFRSCLVQTEGYLLTLYRYIDLNPVRAAIVASAEDYCWSSARESCDHDRPLRDAASSLPRMGSRRESPLAALRRMVAERHPARGAGCHPLARAAGTSLRKPALPGIRRSNPQPARGRPAARTATHAHGHRRLRASGNRRFKRIIPPSPYSALIPVPLFPCVAVGDCCSYQLDRRV